MARNFTAASSHVATLGLGGLGFAFGPGTIAAIVKRAADGAYRAVFQAGPASGSTRFGLAVDATQNVTLRVSGNLLVAASSGATLAAADGWALIAGTKATGAVAGRLHTYKYATGAVQHANTSTTSSNSTPITSATIGAEISSGFWDGDIAIVGAWAEVLSDQDIESLAVSLQPWLRTALRGLWVLDQDTTTQKIVDFSGGGANETALTGTAVSTSSVPVFNYSDGIWLPTLPAAASTNRNGTAATTGGGSSTTQGGKGGLSAATTTGGGSSTPAVRKGAQAPAATSGGGTSVVVGRKGAVSAASSTGGGTSTATGRKGAARAVTTTGGGQAVSTGVKGARAAAASTGGGSSAATGVAGTVTNRNGTASTTGGGSSAATGRKGASRQAATTGGGVCVAQGRKAGLGAASSSGGGASIASWRKAARGACSTTGGGFSSAVGPPHVAVTLAPIGPGYPAGRRTGSVAGPTTGSPARGAGGHIHRIGVKP